MAKLDRSSINLACRLCLHVKNESYYNLFENKHFIDFHKRKVSLQEMIEKHTSIKVSVDDVKPLDICGECVEQLCTSFKFFTSCEESDRTLEDILTKNISDNDNVIISSDDILSYDVPYIEIEIKDDAASSEEEEKQEHSIICIMCDKPVKNLVVHLLSEHLLDVEKLNKCLKCNVGLPQRDNFDYSDHVSSKEHLSKKCVKCNKLCSSIKACHKHQVNCTGTEYCIMCDKWFHSFEELFQHFNDSHKESKSCIYGCDRDYSNWELLQYHILVVHGHKTKCKNCRITFETKEEYAEHCKSNQHKNFCDICNRRFEKKTHYNTHMESHEKPKHICETCGNTYLRLNNLKRHIARDHKGSRFLCQECGKAFTLNYNLEAHMKTVHGRIKKPVCTICGIILRFEESIDEHMKLHKDGKITCFKCRILFETKEELEKHLETHRQVACDICGVRFVYQTQLNKHKKVEHGLPFNNKEKLNPNKYKSCSRCNESFESSREYFKHLKLHRRFNCHLCKKSYTSQYMVKRHIKTHTEGYKNKCEYCNKGFLLKNTLKSHILTHTGLKQFLCNICGKEFRQPAHLATHMNAHTSSRVFKCRFCPKRFVHNTSWVCHERIHTGEKPYVCSVCNKGFYHSTTMKKHQATHSKSTKTLDKLEEPNEEIMDQS